MAEEVERFLHNFQRNFNSHLEPPVQAHLKSVYATLTMSVLTASAGAYIQLVTAFFGFKLPAVLSLLCLMGFMFTPDEQGKNLKTRLMLLLGFTFATGLGIAPLLELALMINPSLIVSALLGTTVIFAGFSLCSMLSPRGRWLFLGGPLMTYLFAAMLFSLVFGFRVFGMLEIYVGLAVMCAFVLFDTQMIIEKRRRGDKDFVKHSLELFIDFVNIFRRLLIILARKEEKKKNERR